ncbi:MAG: molybdenum cofactor guanylyltransferase [Polyangiaceae bacterium]|nr:molybdenum cofactor guanylyltransferase [Polyangiaceae bacterium]
MKQGNEVSPVEARSKGVEYASGLGIAVGGASTRMGHPKGLLEVEAGVTILSRLWELALDVLPEKQVRLLGNNAAYSEADYPFLEDARKGEGPLGGIVALLGFAERASLNRVVVLSCDLPYLSHELLVRLLEEAQAAPRDAIVCPKVDGFYLPFFASYPVQRSAEFRAALAKGHGRLQGLIAGGRQQELILSEAETQLLDDWDRPADLPDDHPFRADK